MKCPLLQAVAINRNAFGEKIIEGRGFEEELA